MKAKHTFIALGMLLGFATSSTAMASLPSKQQPLKPRIVVLTDVSTWETDDSESLVRLFSYADLFEIEGIVFTTGWSLSSIRDDFFQLIHNPLNAYEKDLPNLMKRSAQQGFLKDEEKQRIGYWPSAEYLRSRVVYGSRNRGMKFIGEGNDSDGSRLIIEQAGKKDKRPLWVLLWGGGNTVAQAVWRVKQERSEADLQKFLKKNQHLRHHRPGPRLEDSLRRQLTPVAPKGICRTTDVLVGGKCLALPKRNRQKQLARI